MKLIRNKFAKEVAKGIEGFAKISREQMKPNTSNNDGDYVDEWNIRGFKDVHPSHRTRVYTKEEVDKLIEQGYAKALKSQEVMDRINFAIRRTKEKTLDDVMKRLKDRRNINKVLNEIEQEIAELSHSPQNNSLSKSKVLAKATFPALDNNFPSEDTHIPKESK